MQAASARGWFRHLAIPMDEAPGAPLPREFLDFLGENGLDPSIYASGDCVPRYIRLKPGSESCLRELEGELACEPERVDWLPGFYSLPPRVHIAGTKAYREGKLYGIDAASGAAVSALSITEGDHVLDLCAAPGSVTGVDVSEHRLAACRTMLQKYDLGDRCRLFVADGTTFSVIPARVHSYKSCESTTNEKVQTFQEWTSRRPWKERKREARARQSGTSKSRLGFQYPEIIFYGKHSGVVGLTKDELHQTVSNNEPLNCGYDKVLVDAECTHDGSIRHIQKFEQWGWETLQHRVLNAERTDNLTLLQLKLLINGFRLLKVGGTLVYSTCSLTVAQNEDVVERFLKENASAVLQEIDAAASWPCKSGRLPKTLRFNPSTSQTSGLFVAKFTKVGL
ncbi:rRNA (cytosine-C(5))-methyltransferase NOP2C isoform X2 [Rhodamnia argentea]|uniref:rRNA (Cytosine-C(5))-methyltransferase NOP2C isoform X2 n=1 Tax=Rhodamnia argentea TaxID=178133 RepID=A0ABM3GW65_9MYRT|nr:rRNA (cytosine-C(5))-methyltransferase NOP2C isoform X2 [Rhodamnia argentea]